jgi:integrase
MVVRVGQTKASIYKTPSHGHDSFTVVWYVGANRMRKAFNELDAAILHANAMVTSLAQGESEILRLSGSDRLSFIRAREAVSEFGFSLDTMAVEYRDARRLLRGGSLLDAARYYAAHHLHDIPSRTVTEVYAEMLKAKQQEGLSKCYLDDLESRLGKFAGDFQKQISAVTGAEIRNWIQQMDIANRTRNNFRLAIQTLFCYAKSQRYLIPDWAEMANVPLWKVKQEPVEIFTPTEMGTLLAAAPDPLLPYLAIGAFAGLRTAEIKRLNWAKVNLETGYITMDACITKTNSRRLVPITPNLKAWLTPHAKPSGPVLTLAHVDNDISRLVESTRPVDPANPDKLQDPEVSWRHNALRHSFCSYRLAIVKNAAQVALEAGNSPKIIFQHYRELVTEQEATQWFAITPESTAARRQAFAKQKAEAKAASAKKVVKLFQSAA